MILTLDIEGDNVVDAPRYQIIFGCTLVRLAMCQECGVDGQHVAAPVAAVGAACRGFVVALEQPA